VIRRALALRLEQQRDALDVLPVELRERLQPLEPFAVRGDLDVHAVRSFGGST
jgi:hypothetical protein